MHRKQAKSASQQRVQKGQMYTRVVLFLLCWMDTVLPLGQEPPTCTLNTLESVSKMEYSQASYPVTWDILAMYPPQWWAPSRGSHWDQVQITHLTIINKQCWHESPWNLPWVHDYEATQYLDQRPMLCRYIFHVGSSSQANSRPVGINPGTPPIHSPCCIHCVF